MSKTEGGPSSAPCTTNPLEWIGIYKGEHAEQKKGQFTRHGVVEIPFSEKERRTATRGTKGGIKKQFAWWSTSQSKQKGRLIWSVECPPETGEHNVEEGE